MENPSVSLLSLAEDSFLKIPRVAECLRDTGVMEVALSQILPVCDKGLHGSVFPLWLWEYPRSWPQLFLHPHVFPCCPLQVCTCFPARLLKGQTVRNKAASLFHPGTVSLLCKVEISLSGCISSGECPFAWPNRSEAASSPGMAPQFTATNGASCLSL